ncbi:MAG: ABC transporter permease subunit [Anaerolineae bacterium]|nr:ABC transporter permease subunit [Anaerolineae bacterium]
MKSARIIYHLARADFLERVRRYSFLVMVGLVVFLGYQTAIGNMALELGKYRGEYNSAWVGAMMSLIAAFFLGWFGFYLVKGSVARDRETGVGQIMATTPLTRPLYLIGKLLSNFAVLMAMVVVLALAGLVIQFSQGESTQINLAAFLSPFLLIATPLMMLVAAIAVLFETIPFLQGGFGNLVYFFLFITTLPLFMENDTLSKYPALEPIGLGLLSDQMSTAVSTLYSDYDGSFTLGGGMSPATTTFVWEGVHWTPDILFMRFSLILFAVALTLFGALFFDRFDPSRSKPKRIKSSASDSAEPAPALRPSAPAVSLTALNRAANRFSFFNVLLAELKLLVKGQRWWWYAGAAGLIIASIASPIENVRQIVLPLAWAWHILLLSPIGNREARDNVQQLAFSSASPLWRQLPAQWLAGFIVTLIMGSGAALNFMINSNSVGLFALLSGALFIPSLAIALGVWSGTSKPFEIVYLTLWYLGPMNNVPNLDFIGARSNGHPQIFIPLALALIVFAFFGRSRQLQN